MRRISISAVAIATAGLALFAPRLSAAAEYHWTPGGSPNWPAPFNWTPPRNTPAADDRLVFDSGTVTSAQGIPTQTVGQIVVSNGTQLTLSPTGTGTVLTIAGGGGPDVEVTAGSSLTLGSANTLSLDLATGATGAIAGKFGAVAGAHRFEGLDANAITFTAGGLALADVGFTGNLFGTGGGASGLNSVRFQAGSVYAQLAGANPFGAGQPSSVVIFDPGSLFQLNASIAPSMSGRTYANFEYNGPAAVLSTGSAACSIDNMVINSGSVLLELTGVLTLRGSIITRGPGVLALGPTSGNVNYRLNGTATQYLVDSTTTAVGINLRPSVKLTLDNPGGFAMSSNHGTPVIPGILEFVHGPANFSLDLGGTGSILGASQSTGWVRGSLRRKLPPANPVTRLDVGTDTAYQPLDLRLYGVPDSIRIAGVASPTVGLDGWPYKGTQLDSTTLVPTLFLWATLGTGSFTSFDAVFHYSTTDYPLAADPSSFVARMNPFAFLGPIDPNSGWHSTTTGVRTPTSLEILGATKALPTDNNFYLVVGDPSIVTVSAIDSSKVEGTGPMFPLRVRVQLSEPAVDPVAVDYTTASGSAIAGSDFGTTSGTISFAPGNTTFYVPVPIIADATPEPDETFSLVLSNPFRAVLGHGTATGTILDDDDVTPPSVTVLAPNGGESVVQGASVNLNWSASDNVAVQGVDLLLSRDDGATWESIATGLANTGTYAWTATGPLTQLARLKVVASDAHLQAGQDVSDAAWEITSVDGVSPVVPTAFALDLASENPARGASRIRYALPREQHVRLALLDVRGRVVAVLRDGAEPAGIHEVVWDGRTAAGVAASGVYFVQFRTEDWSAQRRLVRLR